MMESLQNFVAMQCGDDNVITSDFTTAAASLCKNASLQFNAAIFSTVNCDTLDYTFNGPLPVQRLPLLQQKSFRNCLSRFGNLYCKPGYEKAACGKDSISKTITINNCVCTLSTLSNIGTNVGCNGGANGTAVATISVGSGGPYTYSVERWNNSAHNRNGHFIASGLIAGTYSVT